MLLTKFPAYLLPGWACRIQEHGMEGLASSVAGPVPCAFPIPFKSKPKPHVAVAVPTHHTCSSPSQLHLPRVV